jgi:LEA14-like dessication related protein
MIETRDIVIEMRTEVKSLKEAFSDHCDETEETKVSRRRLSMDIVGKLAQWAAIAVAIGVAVVKK